MVKKSDILKKKVQQIDFDKIETVQDLVEAYKEQLDPEPGPGQLRQRPRERHD